MILKLKESEVNMNIRLLNLYINLNYTNLDAPDFNAKLPSKPKDLFEGNLLW